jgi:drug/metabolite transporter (DMT)-like permease
MGTNIFAIISVVFFSVVGAYGTLYLKYGSKHIRECIKHPFKKYQLLLGLSISAISAIGYTITLKYGELSILYPITSMTYIWVAILSTKHLKETMNKWKWAGIIAIIMGVVLIGLSS